MDRSYYSSTIGEFEQRSANEIIGEITRNDINSEQLQKDAWEARIPILKKQLVDFSEGHITFEYTIPRVGKRIDNVFLYKGIVFLLEFKVGSEEYAKADIDQVTDYALDLKDFHEQSDKKLLVPILICTKAYKTNYDFSEIREDVLKPYCCESKGLNEYIKKVVSKFSREAFNYEEWLNSRYKPTPTIIEAATKLYLGHGVEDISRNDASAENLGKTSDAINEIIQTSKKRGEKSICFITGVPGAGKTLAGLNIAVNRQRDHEDEHAVFLSGNGPLVEVLQEALARDHSKRNNVSKSQSKREVSAFLQAVHRFRDDAIEKSDTPPIERVVIFDEAQRAWDKNKLSDFMEKKKHIPGFDQSEPDFLISILDRHEGWATVICLLGGGQEINKGESAGIRGWFEALKSNYPEWKIYLSDRITDSEYIRDSNMKQFLSGIDKDNLEFCEHLHLGVNLRSYRSEKVSYFVKKLLDGEYQKCKEIYNQIIEKYPIYVTRDLAKAKAWVVNRALGTRRYGLIASSGGLRLRKHGVWVKNKIQAPSWFLNEAADVRSSMHLELVATEFDVQGLELDWTVVCWDANLRVEDFLFKSYQFVGTRWNSLDSNADSKGKEDLRLYIKNAYRVLLTRAREGFVIFVPAGDYQDQTALPEFYDGIYSYLRSCGIRDLDE